MAAKWSGAQLFRLFFSTLLEWRSVSKPQECSAIPYRDGIKASLREQGVDFDPSMHGCWAFHGADHESLTSIVRVWSSDPKMNGIWTTSLNT